MLPLLAQSKEIPCFWCDGTGKCPACDGKAICTVCGGEGIYKSDNTPNPKRPRETPGFSIPISLLTIATVFIVTKYFLIQKKQWKNLVV